MPPELRRLLALGLLSLAGTCAHAQTAQFSGQVTDLQNAAVPNAEVRVVDQATSVEKKTKTNSEGLYVFPFLQPSRYKIFVQAQGFQTAVSNEVTLNVGQTLVVNFQLRVGAMQQEVTVTAGEALVNTTDGSVSTVVDRQFVDNIPLNGRSLQSLISLTPGVTSVPPIAPGQAGEFSINGQRSEQNYYTVDGVAANTGTFPGAGAQGASGIFPSGTALGTTQSLVSLDALEEFRIQTSTYSAEYGRMPGGQISFVTRSGTNDWHGSGYDYLRNSVLDANNWFNNAGVLPKTAERQNDFGGTLGGPVLVSGLYDGRNRTFFFFSYEGLRLATPQPAITVFVPTLALRQSAPAALQPLLNALPQPNGPANGTTGMAQFTANYSVPGKIDATSIRLDQTFGNKITAFARFSDSPSSSFSRIGSLSTLAGTLADMKLLTLGATVQFSNHVVNETRFNLTWNENQMQDSLDNFGGAMPYTLNDIRDANGQPTPGIKGVRLLLNFGGIAQSLLQNQDNTQTQVNLVDGLSYAIGRHRLKFGFDYRRLSTVAVAPDLFELGSYNNATQVQQNLVAAGASLISFHFGIPVAPIFTNLSLYAQDESKTTSRLTLSLGLRWELNPSPTDANGNLPYTLDQVTSLATARVAPKGTPLWSTTYKNFAPRLGAAYQVRQQPGWETVVRGGFGLFYDLGNTQATSGYSGIGIGGQILPANVPFPYTAAQLSSVPQPSVAPPYNSTVVAFDPHLQLPYTFEWNLAVEQSLGKIQVFKVTYLGAAGRRMLIQQQLRPAAAGNPNFTSTGLAVITSNRCTSDYDALEMQYQRRLTQGLQALASYTWSHSIDQASVNVSSLDVMRANSNFDIRHNFQAALTYDIPRVHGNAPARAILGHWSVEDRLFARSALPFDINGGTVFLAGTGLQQQIRADLVPGQPIYVSDSTAPGGRRVNFNAFTIPTAAEQAAGNFGTVPRNLLRGFTTWQLDQAIRREFPLRERLKLQFRAEAFNVFNHPSFGAIRTTLTSGAALFGVATGTTNNQLNDLNPLYQVGGPRSIQFSLRLAF